MQDNMQTKDKWTLHKDKLYLWVNLMPCNTKKESQFKLMPFFDTLIKK